MKTDFGDAHDRHWEDAGLLEREDRLANADQLYGFSAECGLKQMMQAMGMAMSVKGMPANRDDQVHANDIWVRFDAYRGGHAVGSDYSLPETNPFSDWHVGQRYHRRDAITADRVRAHREGAQVVRSLLARFVRDGWAK